ncbi:cupin [Polaromonas hydrogenivorans]|uniref:Cupin n=1 Tax=Polaromonas hydrogenivorans TaxID=335476 RepID=A0AAU7LZN6_9BURK
MEREEFGHILAAEGFEQAVTVTREPDGFLVMHTHPFEAKALILSGELRIKTALAEQTYQAGQVFHLLAGEPHAERYGPEGVAYLVGRK